ncbi:hypothetical protein [Flavobacterium poyangense]|uniref:hypothetical protein n=1 Tax=Flavobacterium poyangense TaxID=2204302 RepID=UPI00141F206D|nr:hypothetical protein [Flavobacterium sp. JXAS1]
MKNQFLRNILLIVIILILIGIATVVQGYWALWDYKSSPSSSCLDCDIFTDLVISSLLPAFFIGIVNFLSFKFLWKKKIKVLGTAFVLFVSWFIIDTEIFIEREASWSTYTNVWEISFLLAAIPILTIGILFIMLFNYVTGKISFARNRK